MVFKGGSMAVKKLSDIIDIQWKKKSSLTNHTTVVPAF